MVSYTYFYCSFSFILFNTFVMLPPPLLIIFFSIITEQHFQTSIHLHDFMLNYAISIFDFVHATEPIKYASNLSNVKNVHHE